MAIDGWTDPKMAALYTRKASRRKLAADAMKLVVPAQTEHKTVPLAASKITSGTKEAKKTRKSNVQ